MWGKKSHNAINIVCGVSAAAVMVVTAAMVCVLSVMNGFGLVIENMFSQFDPDIRITSTTGAPFQVDTKAFREVQTLPCVQFFSQTLEETALIEFQGHQIPAKMKGVDSVFRQLTHIDSIIVDGSFDVRKGDFYYAVMGIGLSNQLGAGAHFVQPLHLYAPRREGVVNMMAPEKSFNRYTCFMSGVFAVNQVKYDDRLALIDLTLARRLFDYDSTTVTAVELQITGPAKQAKQQIKNILGDQFMVLDRYEQQADFFHILRIEKWLTALLMVFILLIASFNIIGSLTMLIIDKRDDIQVLHHLGADKQQIRRIFLLEGWMISSIGALLGLVLGVVLCLVQEHCGVIKLGDGVQYVLEAYPVHVDITDLFLVIVIVLSLGFVAAWFPTKHLEIDDTSK